jgi:hypothetical protein
MVVMSQSFPPPPPLQPEPQSSQYGLQPQPPPPMPPQTLGYASPRNPSASYGYGLWRQGDRVVATREIDLGDACVKCGAGCDGWRWNKTLYWHEPWVYALIIPGVLIYAICALVLRKSAKVSAGLCPVHRKRRYTGIFLVWTLSLLGLGCFIGGIGVSANSKTPELGVAILFAGIAMWIIAAVISSVMTRVLVPKKIDEHYAWYGGADEAYLQTLQPIG